MTNEFLLALNVLSGVFMAAAIEAVETYTQVVCVARCISKKAALTGFLLAISILALLTTTLGMTILYLVPIQLLHFIFGLFALLVGLRWLRDGVLRYSGWLALRDETALYEQSRDQLTASFPSPSPSPAKITAGQFWFGVVATFKPTFIEGLETVYLVLVLGYPYRLVAEAAGTALAAYIFVGLVALALFQGPLRAVPINLLKAVVGLQMVTLGTMWAGTALGVVWWRENISYFLVLGVYIGAAFVLTKLLKRSRTKYLAWHTAQNGKLSRYSRVGIRTLLISQASATTSIPSPSTSRPKLEVGLATLNRLFFGDVVILLGLPVVIYLTSQLSEFFTSVNWMIVVFPPLGVFFMVGLISVLSLACSQFVAWEVQRENSLILSPPLPATAPEAEVAG